ncbi:unnamed protein product [Mycena citricolor]|uniref:ubiquitinyl hydrolase 1 n=1 Tax=Mycena citricolor TaxID=2018698 RepID=A0AAD2K7X2_9AGAR|nr:unnamed protein product [Mycena citricolor]
MSDAITVSFMQHHSPGPLLQGNADRDAPESSSPEDLVGGPFAVLESDPGVFTSLTRRLGIRGLELVELYDIEPWAVDHLRPRGLIFCFLWGKDVHRPADFADPLATKVWFANQLSDDACASLAILNVALNCPEVQLDGQLEWFRRDTETMSPVMKGLAISSSSFIRSAHTGLARPSDIRGALHNLASTTLAAAKKKEHGDPKTSKGRPVKTGSPVKPKKEVETEEVYHFIGYVPAFGKVWELDGLKSGPLEVGELPEPGEEGTDSGTWMDVVRPALRMKMQKYGGAASGANIRFSLLALVDGLYEKANDHLEFLKRDRVALERRLTSDQSGWQSGVDTVLLQQVQSVFESPDGSAEPGRTFALDFGSRRMTRDIEIMEMPVRALPRAWEQCVSDALLAKIALEDEVLKTRRANTEHVKRTHDYEPFLREYVRALQGQELLDLLLDGDTERHVPKRAKTKGG